MNFPHPQIISLEYIANSQHGLRQSRGRGGGGIAQSGEGATPGEEVPGSIPAMAARSLLVGSVSV